LSPANFEADWRRAASAIERALELVTLVSPDGFGVFAEKWLPGFGLIPILAALRSEIDTRRLGERERADLRRWYWCNVFMERYSSAVESKSRKDYLEMTRYWAEGGPEPEVFREAQNWIGAPGFRIRGSASYASAVYSGAFCLLALRNARDWRRGEDIQLQELQDHHIFPQAYLKRQSITKRVDVNTIANRTLISNQTNGKIKDKAPADYTSNLDIFPSGARADLLGPHFIDGATLELLSRATEELPAVEVGDLYQRFLQARELGIIEEVRRACGITRAPDADAEDSLPDDFAEDIMEGEDTFDDEIGDLEIEFGIAPSP